MGHRSPAAFSGVAGETAPRRFGGFSRQQLFPIFAMGAVILLWASAFAGIRIALDGYSPTDLATVRYVVASVVLVIYALLTRMPLPKRRDLPGILLCGFVGFTLYNILLNAGEQTVSTGVASFVISSEIGIIAVLATLFLGERLNVIGWVGVLTCLVGVLIISFSLGDGFQLSSGALLVFGATLSISVYSVMQKPLLRRYSAIQVTAYAIWAGTLCLLVLAPGAITRSAAAPAGATLAVVYMGIFPGVIAYIAWSYVLARIPASRAGSFLAIIPLVALLLGWLLLSEVPSLIAMLGGAVVLAGVTLVNRHSGK